MTVINNAAVTILVRGEKILPGESRQYTEMVFNTLDIHSEIGSCTVISEYTDRFFENYGKLVAKEGTGTDEIGRKEIVVSQTD